jgi:hypothetical protein
MASLVLSPFPDLMSESTTGSAVSASDWIINGEKSLDEVTELSGWDYGTPLTLRRDFTLDCASVLDACGLGKGAVVCVATIWGTGGAFEAWEPGSGTRIELNPGESRTFELTLSVPSPALAGVLKVTTHIVLESAGANPKPEAARILGSVLWEQRARLELEGTASRLSVTVADFRERYGDGEGDAVWTIQTSPDWLSCHPSVGLQIVFNKLNQKVVDSIRQHRPGPKEKAIRSTIAFDVGRLILLRALADVDGFDDHAQFEEGTTGASIKARLKSLFPGLSIGQIRTLQQDEADRFERLLQAHHQLFAGST